MTVLRRLDHVAIVVRDTETALAHFRDRLGLAVVSTEEIDRPPVRLTYLDCGNTYLQLVEPRDATIPLARHLDEYGEGLHHICFGVDDVPTAVGALAGSSAPAITLGSGRGRVSAFVPGEVAHGVVIECTEFRRAEDVGRVSGWLSD